MLCRPARKVTMKYPAVVHMFIAMIAGRAVFTFPNQSTGWTPRYPRNLFSIPGFEYISRNIIDIAAAEVMEGMKKESLKNFTPLIF